ncbi:hypothetical protein N7466_003661 [Penicillium verhagenii]|uniref:uncharacterized protein n=1 Tax=Penicillium verhagenii TaxID=1562060 RepID=UPI0025457913|nr:uncharacterized protein N7466_003661 [Penicillium verhagenii]KAJ5934114.1 hypothetical protein N7466_003661 [Penicillium verhagenii]
MASSTSIDALASAIVARFLRTYNYTETLQAFVREADLPLDVGQASGDDTHNLTIQSLLEEKRTFDQTVNFERYGNDGKENEGWSIPAPSKPTVIQTPTSSNILSASVELWNRSSSEADAPDPAKPLILSTSADRQAHLFETASEHASLASLSGLFDSPVLSYVSILQGRYILMANMAGNLLLQQGTRVLDTRKDHAKYVVKVVAHEDQSPSSTSPAYWVATAGWDATVFLYRIEIPENAPPVIGEPVAHIKLATNPESLLFVPHVDSGELFLLVSRRDSTYIYYHEVTSSNSESRLLGKQNLAPHSNAWVAFSPACMALSPHDPGLLAVATSTLPHLKVIIVRLLFPSVESLGESDPADAAVTQASQALAALALSNREDAAILLQANTFASQTAYSTPQVVWRPDGSGVWVNGDDGLVRGIETKTGKLVATLKDGHEIGCKVRSIWAGYVDLPGEDESSIQEEWVISGGFDKRLIVWKV